MLDASSSSQISQRAFLVGCPRSGTTLLQSMLMGHPRIASFPETHFFDRGFGGSKRWILHETLRGWYLWYLLARWLVKTDQVSIWGARHIPVSWSKATMVEAFRQILDHRTLGRDRDVWVEKTPRHLHFLGVIAEYIPSAKFIHIVRDGRAVVASLHRLAASNPERWGTYRSIDAAVERWNRSIRDTVEWVTDESHVTVCYDELVDAPQPSVRKVCALLDVDFDVEMIDRFQDEAARVTKAHESWKERAATGDLDHRGLQKYHDEFSEDERTCIDSALDWASYRSLGYDPL